MELVPRELSQEEKNIQAIQMNYNLTKLQDESIAIMDDLFKHQDMADILNILQMCVACALVEYSGTEDDKGFVLNASKAYHNLDQFSVNVKELVRMYAEQHEQN